MLRGVKWFASAAVLLGVAVLGGRLVLKTDRQRWEVLQRKAG